MKLIVTKTAALSILILLLVSFSQVAIVFPASNNQDKSLAIMSNVFCLDLSKYTVILNGTSDHSNSVFGPNVNQQSLLYTLVSGDNIISADLNFVGDYFWYCNLDIKGKPIYTQEQSVNVLDQSKSVMQRYQTYASQHTGLSTSYISSMASMLDTISELKSTDVTVGNMKLDISLTSTRISNIPTQTLKWFYTEKDVDITRKAITLRYTDNVLTSISDTWNLYSIGNLNSLSKEEILNIAWSKAQNLTLQFISENGTTYEIKPDLSNVTTDVTFSLQPRNNTELYPSWIVTYYFAKPYGQNHGIEVGIWGDTGQVVFCKPLVILGESDPSESTKQPTLNDDLGINTLLAIIAGTGLIVIITTVGIIIKKRRK